MAFVVEVGTVTRGFGMASLENLWLVAGFYLQKREAEEEPGKMSFGKKKISFFRDFVTRKHTSFF